MESNSKLKEIDIENCTCYYFEDTIKLEDFHFYDIYWVENHTKMFWFITFYATL